MGEEIFSWLKSIPIAPVYYPTLEEFQDPISYIFKIEKEASRFGICKIIPPVPPSSEKVTIANLNRSLSLANQGSSPTFTTRMQYVGFSPRRHHRLAQRPVWESGEKYTLAQFEAKAKTIVKKVLPAQGLTPLEIETLYWKAQSRKPFSVEYANDMPGSAFGETGAGGGGVKQGRKEVCDVMTVGDTLWNLRRIARAKGSLLRFKEEEIDGVTSPMIYMGMLYSWFAWHVEDHDLHSLNYMHMGARKTWYGIPIDGASLFEDVVREQAFGGETSPLVTFATLVGKTTIVSPEVLVKAGVPCYRLVQNPGEFIVTFPRAYHSGFSHGFNCAEAVNMATPGWLPVAREAAIRRASIDLAPMVSDSQLLYDLAMSMSSSKQKNKQLSSRQRFKTEGDAFVKRTFVQDVMHSNELLNALGNGSPITCLSEDVLKTLVLYGINLNVDESVVDRRPKRVFDYSNGQPNRETDPASIFSCVTCGSSCYSCVAIVQPSKTAAYYLMSNEDANVIDIPALKLLAFAYGDSSDLEEGSELAKLVLESKHALNGVRPMYSSASEKDSSRLHVFCLDHAREVEQRLRSVGGVQMLLLCHQDYPKMNDAAREMGEELGISDDMWIDVKYKDITKQDKTMIQWALDDEETASGNQDWAVKLGIDIFYSAKLGCSPLYKKQMPHNAVINNAFRQDSPFNDQSSRKMSNRVHPMFVARDDDDKDDQMSNRVHPILIVIDDDDKDDDNNDDDIQQEVHRKVSLFPKTNATREKHSEVRTSARKRKRSLKGKFLEIEASSLSLLPADYEEGSDYDPSKSSKRRITRKPARKLEVRTKPKTKKNQDQVRKGKKAHVVAISEEEKRAFSSGIHTRDMTFRSKQNLTTHNQNFYFAVRSEKQFLSHKSLQRHRRVHTDERTLKGLSQGRKMTCACALVWAQTKEPPYVCAKNGCGQRFKFLSEFNLHRSETGHV